MFSNILSNYISKQEFIKGLDYANFDSIQLHPPLALPDGVSLLMPADVWGSSIYETVLTYNSRTHDVEHSCDCPAHTASRGCKHVTGLALLLDDILVNISESYDSQPDEAYEAVRKLFGENLTIITDVHDNLSAQLDNSADTKQIITLLDKVIDDTAGTDNASASMRKLAVLNNYREHSQEQATKPTTDDYEYRVRIAYEYNEVQGQIIQKKRYKNGKLSKGKVVKTTQNIPDHLHPLILSYKQSYYYNYDFFVLDQLSSQSISVARTLPRETETTVIRNGKRKTELVPVEPTYQQEAQLRFLVTQKKNSIKVGLHLMTDDTPIAKKKKNMAVLMDNGYFVYSDKKSMIYLTQTTLSNDIIRTFWDDDVTLTRNEFQQFLSQPGAEVLLEHAHDIDLGMERTEGSEVPESSENGEDSEVPEDSENRENTSIKAAKKSKKTTTKKAVQKGTKKKTDALEGEIVIMPDPETGVSLRIGDDFASISTEIVHRYEDYTISHTDPRRFVKNTENIIIKRHRDAELANHQEMHEQLTRLHDHYDADDGSYHRHVGSSIDDYFDAIDEMIAGGTHVQYEQNTKKFSAKTVSVSVNITTGIDRFETDVQIEHDEVKIDESDLIIEALRSGAKTVTLNDGMTLLLKDDLQTIPDQLDSLGIDTKKLDQPQKIGKYAFGLLHDQGLSKNIKMGLDKEATKLKKDLETFTGVGKKKKIPELQATLRDYQLKGYNWLLFLYKYNFGGVLADDMGLGKTIQTIALLCHVYSKKSVKHPSIVICPTSLTYNRQDELTKFAPHLSVGYIATSTDDIDAMRKECQVIVVSYGIMANILENGRNKKRHYAILDESQNIKNPNTKRAQYISDINSSYRLALSGTPIENNLLELRSVFNFLMPGFLGSQRSFEKMYSNGDETALQLLSKKIKPFVLRRTKEEVLTDLPPKVEEVITLEMEPKQKVLYERLKKTYKNEILQKIDTDGLGKSQFAVLDALLKLRQCCLSPQLVNISNNTVTSSIKLTYLAENIEDMVTNGHNVLIFSQFTGFLTHVTDILEDKKISHLYLDGQTPAKKRKKLVNDFNDGDASVFVISLKAGGTGLNLTAADYVIHLDPWRNPAVEDQATDRAHRMGQTKTVFVQKLIVKDSIEEKILTLQEQKKDLVDQVLSGSTKGKLSKEDVEYIFA